MKGTRNGSCLFSCAILILFSFPEKEEVNEREKRMIPFSPVPAPSLSERKKEENKMKRIPLFFPTNLIFKKKWKRKRRMKKRKRKRKWKTPSFSERECERKKGEESLRGEWNREREKWKNAIVLFSSVFLISYLLKKEKTENKTKRISRSLLLFFSYQKKGKRKTKKRKGNWRKENGGRYF